MTVPCYTSFETRFWDFFVKQMTQTAEQIQLPDYDNPPVVETVLGVQFKPLAGFTNAHLGAFWQRIGSETWPKLWDLPLVPRQEELFTPEAEWRNAFRLQISQVPSARLRIGNVDGNHLIQIQNGRFHLNWLGEGGDKYPGFKHVREEFGKYLRQFIDFLLDSQLGSIEFDQWETTYLNTIPQNVWKTPADWGFFRPLNGMPTIEGLIEAESFSGEWHFVIPDKRGRLHIHWQHAKNTETEETSHIQLNLTARGPIPEGPDSFSSVMASVELGHHTIVNSFCSLMTDTANSEWKLKNVPTR